VTSNTASHADICVIHKYLVNDCTGSKVLQNDSMHIVVIQQKSSWHRLE